MPKPHHKKKLPDPAAMVNADGTANAGAIAIGMTEFLHQKGAGHVREENLKHNVTAWNNGRRTHTVTVDEVQVDPGAPFAD